MILGEGSTGEEKGIKLLISKPRVTGNSRKKYPRDTVFFKRGVVEEDIKIWDRANEELVDTCLIKNLSERS